MMLLILFGFLAGVVTMLSPCVLPVLPIVLSGGLGGGKSRPLGIVAGFVASFTLFTLTLSAIVQATGISANALRYLAVVVILCFGLILTVPRLQEAYSLAAGALSTRLQNLGNRGGKIPASSGERSGFAGGVLVGLGLGLVWTPCVGPIMASVLGLALTRSIDAGAVFIAIAYSLGAAIPMLGVMLGGRTLLRRVPLLLRNTERIQRAFGVLIIGAALAIGFEWDRKLQAAILRVVPDYGAGLTAIENTERVQASLEARARAMRIGDEMAAPRRMQSEGLEDYGPAPEIVSRGEWFNTERYAGHGAAGRSAPPLAMQQLRGKVVLIDFWTYSCVNCVRTLPHLKKWFDTFGADHFVIIGVHTPEFEFEKDSGNVRRAIADLGVTWPVVLDNEYLEWRAYGNRYWPAHYFIDAKGRIRHKHFGEGGYAESERVIRDLLAEAGYSSVSALPSKDPEIESGTPETYLGSARARGFVSDRPLAGGSTTDYAAAPKLKNGEWTLAGKWSIAGEYAAPENQGTLKLGFDATNVYLVIEPESPGGKIEVRVDGKASADTADVRNGILHPDRSRLYHLVRMATPGVHILELKVKGNMRLFAFTFG